MFFVPPPSSVWCIFAVSKQQIMPIMPAPSRQSDTVDKHVKPHLVWPRVMFSLHFDHFSVIYSGQSSLRLYEASHFQTLQSCFCFVFCRRRFTNVCLDNICGYLVELQSLSPNSVLQQTIGNFKSLQAKLEKLHWCNCGQETGDLWVLALSENCWFKVCLHCQQRTIWWWRLYYKVEFGSFFPLQFVLQLEETGFYNLFDTFC